MIERIRSLNIEYEAFPVDQPVPSRKFLKWAIKTLESVHPDEVRKTRMKNSTRQDNGREANNSGDDMDVSFYCELN